MIHGTKREVRVNRRVFLRAAEALPILNLPEATLLEAEEVPSEWRTFEVRTRVEIPKSSGTTRVWLSAALIIERPFQKTISNVFTADGGTARMVEGRS
jgi:hypothetical protein